MKAKELEKEFLATIAASLCLSGKRLSLQTPRSGLKEWDSLGHLKLFLALEEKFKVKFSMKETAVLEELPDIFRHIKQKVGRS